MSVHFIIGDCEPLRRKKRDAIRRAALAQVGMPAFNHTRHFASSPDADDALSSARTLPVMAELRLVELSEFQAADSSLFALVAAYLESPNPQTVLVVSGSGFPAVRKGEKNWASRFRTWCKKNDGEWYDASTKTANPMQFVTERMAAEGKELTAAVARHLIQTVGPDLSHLEHETAKLANYVGERSRVSNEDVDVVCANAPSAEVWDLTTAVATGDGAGSLVAHRRLVDGGEDARRLLAMIAWQMRDVLRVRELLARGAPDSEIRRAVRIRPHVLSAVRRSTQSGRVAESGWVLRRLAQAHHDMNHHRGGADAVLEDLLHELTAKMVASGG